MYKRKTKDVYIIMANYGYGWEEETQADNYKEAKQNLKDYRENGSGQYYLKTKREKIQGE
jgi:spermidine/putrescine-binding protein